MPNNTFYLGGKEITTEEASQILEGKDKKALHCPKGEDGVPLAMLTDHFMVTDKQLDMKDPVLQECLSMIKMEISNTLIVQMQNPFDIEQTKRSAVYGCW